MQTLYNGSNKRLAVIVALQTRALWTNNSE